MTVGSSAMPVAEPVPSDDVALKAGGALAVAGGLGYFALLLLHGDLPDHTTEAALAHIASRPEWRALKLALIVAVLCWLGAFTALARSLAGISGLLGRWAAACAGVGIAVVVVEYAVIGHALKEIAVAWDAAPTAASAQASIRTADILLAITSGLFHSFVALMLGLPYVLLGSAVVLARTYPRWLGWIAIVCGGGAVLAGATRFLGVALVPYPLLYGGFVLPLCLWLTAIGVLMWRSATRRNGPQVSHGA